VLGCRYPAAQFRPIDALDPAFLGYSDYRHCIGISP
jgi:hypothetical protein